jgi:hypothetical protein
LDVKPRGEKPVRSEALRAAKLSYLTTIAEACERFGVTKAEVSRARKVVAQPTLAEIALAALTNNGAQRSGDGLAARLDGIAGYLQYVNKDDSTADSVRALLEDAFVVKGVLLICGDKWSLPEPWP